MVPTLKWRGSEVLVKAAMDHTRPFGEKFLTQLSDNKLQKKGSFTWR